MCANQTSRRKFLKFLGLSAFISVANTNLFAGKTDHSDIHELSAEQKQFMLDYEKWMDEFIEAIRTKKKEPYNSENIKNIAVLSEHAAAWKPQLTEYMKNKKFEMIYQASIERMIKEI